MYLLCLCPPVAVQAFAGHAQARARARGRLMRERCCPQVYLGEQYVNNPTLSDVTFLVEVPHPAAHVGVCRKRPVRGRKRGSACADVEYEQAHAAMGRVPWAGAWQVQEASLTRACDLQGRKFHAHRIALLASSDTFRAMFDGHYKEKEASQIPIPNIRFCVFESMMRCIYTGARAAPRGLQWLPGRRSCRGPCCRVKSADHIGNMTRARARRKGVGCARCCRAVRVQCADLLHGVERWGLRAGSVDVHACIAEELLQAADQYMLEGLKRLCEAAISSALAVDTLAAMHETAENFNAPQARPRPGCAALCANSGVHCAGLHGSSHCFICGDLRRMQRGHTSAWGGVRAPPRLLQALRAGKHA